MINSFKAQLRLHEENLLFFKRLLRNPKSLGALVPSSKALANFICQYVSLSDGAYVVEVGAGTGRFTKALLNSGLHPKKFYVVELDSELCAFLRRKFPSVQVIQGDAGDLAKLLPEECLGHVDTIISGIPFVNLSAKEIEKIVHSCFALMSPEGKLLQFTYSPLSPLSAKKLCLKKKKLGYVFHNVPPATVWQYQKNKGPNPMGPIQKLIQKGRKYPNGDAVCHLPQLSLQKNTLGRKTKSYAKVGKLVKIIKQRMKQKTELGANLNKKLVHFKHSALESIKSFIEA